MLRIETSKLAISPSVYIGYIDPLPDNAAFDTWINEHIKIINDKQVILGSDIKRGKEGKDIRDYILGLGYKETKHIKYNNKDVRGYIL